MSFSKERLIDGEVTIKISRKTRHQLNIIKAQEDLATISDAIDFILDKTADRRQ